MSVYKRGKTWWVKFQVQGETVRRSTGATQKRKAQEVERELRFQFADELHARRTGKPTNATYQDALLKWIDAGAPKSMWSAARNTRPYLDEVQLHLVVPAAHNMKQEMLKRGLKHSTINRRLAVVRRVLNVAYKEWEWISQPLGQRIQLLSEKNLARELYLSKEEVTILVSNIKSEEVKNIVLLAAYTGLRQGELRGLTPESWKKPYLILSSKTKSGKPRTVPLIEELHYIAGTLPFNLSEWDIRKEFEKAREEMERPDIRFHDLRHTFASWLANDPDVPLTVIRDILGHSNLSVTSKYAHLRGNNLDIVSNALSSKKGHKNRHN